MRKTFILALAIEVDDEDTYSPDFWGWNSWHDIEKSACVMKDRASNPSVKLLSCKDVNDLVPTEYMGVPVKVFLPALERGQGVGAIKAIRTHTGLGLYKAKQIVDAYRLEHGL